MNKVKNSYKWGECPDCGDNIPDDVVDGQECKNCGHVFYEQKPERICKNCHNSYAAVKDFACLRGHNPETIDPEECEDFLS